MPKFEVGDKVRIMPRKDWPTPPGYIFGNAEGVVGKWVDYDEAMGDFPDYTYVRISRARGAAKVYACNGLFFRTENLEKV